MEEDALASGDTMELEQLTDLFLQASDAKRRRREGDAEMHGSGDASSSRGVNQVSSGNVSRFNNPSREVSTQDPGFVEWCKTRECSLDGASVKEDLQVLKWWYLFTMPWVQRKRYLRVRDGVNQAVNSRTKHLDNQILEICEMRKDCQDVALDDLRE